MGWPKGKPFSEEMKLKMSKSHIGKIRSEESKDKQSASRIGYKFSEEVKAKMSESAKAVNHYWMVGNKHSLGYKCTEEQRERHRIARSKRVLPFANTSIEKTVQDYLEFTGIPYVKYEAFKVRNSYHQVDIFIPTLNLAIECDGKYWHNSPKSIKRDNEVDEEVSKHCDIVRLNEQDILNDNYKELLKWYLMM